MPARLVLIVLALTTLVGCERVPRDQAAFDRPVELELWTWALRPRFNQFIRELIADFEQKHPGVRVTWVDVPADAMQRKFFAAAAAGRMPDVVNFSDRHFAQFAALGGLLPLDDLLEDDPTEIYVEGALEVCRIDGQLLALPWYLSTQVRLINTDLLRRGNLSVEQLGRDWDTLLAQAPAFREATGRYLFGINLGTDSDLPMMILANGQTLVRDHPQVGLESNLLAEENVALIRTWVEAYRQDLVPRDSATESFSQLVRNYKDGNVAMINANALRPVRDEAPDVFRATVVAEPVTGRLGRSGIAVTHIAVGAQTRHPRQAAALARHVTSAPWQTRLAVEASRNPSTLESLGDPAFALPDPATAESDPDYKLRLATAKSNQWLTTARAFQVTVGPWPDMRSVFNEQLKSVLIGNKPLESALAEVDREWNRMLRAAAVGESWK